MFWKNHLSSIFNFSVKSKSNSLIFDSVDSSSSPMYKVPFSQFLSSIHRLIRSNSKRSSEISLFPCGFDPYLLLYPSIRLIFIKLVSLDFFLTQDRVFFMTSKSRSIRESGARCSEESWINSHDEREGWGDLDTPSDEMESLHRLLEAKLCNEEGPLPSLIHQPNPWPTGMIELLYFLDGYSSYN